MLTHHFYGGVCTQLDCCRVDGSSISLCGSSGFRAFRGCESYSPVYLAGDAHAILNNLKLQSFKVVYDLSYHYDDSMSFVMSAQLPIDVHGVGIFFRNLFFEQSFSHYFDKLSSEHKFQRLTLSKMNTAAYRSGLYLSHVEDTDEGRAFHLLRCSTNFRGPTENFTDTDREILAVLEKQIKQLLPDAATPNHVLAQIYHNTLNNKKARISRHSDKTKDMPDNGVIAFCSFYHFDCSSSVKQSSADPFDWRYKRDVPENSVLPRLHFQLKKEGSHWKRSFEVKLYPNSVFVIPLSTNRLYTHAVEPPGLPSDKLPTRMGYVARCSNVKAVFKDGTTYIDNTPLSKDYSDELLKFLYYVENTSDEIVQYPPIYFSFNDGDYLKPLLKSPSLSV